MSTQRKPLSKLRQPTQTAGSPKRKIDDLKHDDIEYQLEEEKRVTKPRTNDENTAENLRGSSSRTGKKLKSSFEIKHTAASRAAAERVRERKRKEAEKKRKEEGRVGMSTGTRKRAVKTTTASRPASTATAGTSSRRSATSRFTSKSSAPKEPQPKKLTNKEIFQLTKEENAQLNEKVSEQEALIQSLQTQIENDSSTSGTLVEQNKNLSEQQVVLNDQLSKANETVENLRNMVESISDSHKTQLLNIQEEHDREQSALKTQNRVLESERDTLKSQYEVTKAEVLRHKSTIESITGELGTTKDSLTRTSAELATSQAKCADQAANIESLNATVAEKDAKIAALIQECLQYEAIRRQLHEKVQTLKGNIRVFARVRPLLEDEVDESSSSSSSGGVELDHMQFPAGKDSEGIALSSSSTAVVPGAADKKKTWKFGFDRVFQPGTSQAEVFDEISQLVQSALDGFNVTLFAYGQTGSGKTFTMEGPSLDSEDRGMIPRAVEQIFDSSSHLQEKGWNFTFSVSYLEIYNETLRDLLTDGKSDTKLDIKHNSLDKTTSVPDLTIVSVSNPQEVHDVLDIATGNRSVGRTKSNDRSSRSHSVFQMYIQGSNDSTNESVDGLLNLVDLAGSERLNKSQAQGQRLKETQAINKSLSCLGDTIAAIASGSSHVPYRNSKLTYLLQNSLGGNSKTLMFANINPATSNVSESVCTLRFAQKVAATKIGTAKKNGGRMNIE